MGVGTGTRKAENYSGPRLQVIQKVRLGGDLGSARLTELLWPEGRPLQVLVRRQDAFLSRAYFLQEPTGCLM